VSAALLEERQRRAFVPPLLEELGEADVPRGPGRVILDQVAQDALSLVASARELEQLSKVGAQIDPVVLTLVRKLRQDLPVVLPPADAPRGPGAPTGDRIIGPLGLAPPPLHIYIQMSIGRGIRCSARCSSPRP
jgi:hypothetical protein